MGIGDFLQGRSLIDWAQKRKPEKAPFEDDDATLLEEKMEVLLIEDQISDAKLIQRILRKITSPGAVELTPCTRLSEGIDLLKQKKFDCVILDLSLPDSQGISTIDSLRVHFPFLPIVVLTGFDDDSMGVSAIQAGAQDYLAKGSSLNCARIVRSIKYAIERQNHLMEVYTEKSRYQHSADHDPLTDLPNRNLLKDRIRNAIALAKRDAKQFAVVFLDLDGFKEVNDAFGHLVGDKILRAAALRFSQRLRQSDTVARIGGDEFLFVCYDLASVSDYLTIARKVISSFREPFQIDGNKFLISASIGLSIFPDDASEVEDLISLADAAMYRAKQAGKNQFKFHSSKFNLERHNSSEKIKDFVRAIQAEEFEIHYQPCFDSLSENMIAVQALSRWKHPQRGLVEAKDFIDLAEESGMIQDFNGWMLKQACEDFKIWRNQASSLQLSIALSKKQLLSSRTVKTAIDVVEAAGLSRKNILFEVSELSFQNSFRRNTEFLKDLKSLGFGISLDGLGTGLSSLTQLRDSIFDEAKIDRSLISKLESDQATRGIVSSLVQALKSFNIKSTAEGVETAEQYQFLKDIHCDRVQGYLLGKPLSMTELKKNISD